MALVSIIVALLINQDGAIPAALSAALLIGLLNFLISRLKLEPLITTLAALIMWRGIAQVVGDGQIVPAHPFEALGRAGLSRFGCDCGVVIAGSLLLCPLYAFRTSSRCSRRRAARLASVPNV